MNGTTALDALLNGLPHPPTFEYDWARLGDIGPLAGWFERMARTPQNPQWHGEGDVWTHTRLVCEALVGLAEFRTLPDEERSELALAALLHDIGKAVCTRLEDGQWVSPRHGPVGARLARSLLWRSFGLCGDPAAQRFREAVCLLIRHHTKPLHLIEGKAPAVAALKLAADGELAPGFTLKGLCLLSEADALGREAPDVPELLDAVGLTRELAREEGCFEGPYPFRSDRVRRALFAGGRVWKDQALYDDAWGEVILMCGLPGTGKDTWIRTVHPDWPTVCLDDLRRELHVSPAENQGRVVQAAKERAKALLRERRPFIWNATSLTPLRAQQIELFESYGARVRVVYLETGWAENLRRNAGRAAAVPEATLNDMLDKLEPPERFEAQCVEWLCV